MVRGIISIGGEKKYPLFHCCQRGRKLISNKKIKNKKSKKIFPSMPKGENVEHNGTILSLMSTRCRRIHYKTKYHKEEH
jgi:hypothetical protein